MASDIIKDLGKMKAKRKIDEKKMSNLAFF